MAGRKDAEKETEKDAAVSAGKGEELLEGDIKLEKPVEKEKKPAPARKKRTKTK